MDVVENYENIAGAHSPIYLSNNGFAFERINKDRSDFWICANVVISDLNEYEIQNLFAEMTNFIKNTELKARDISTIVWEDVCDCKERPNTHTHFWGTAVDKDGRSIWIKPSILCEK